MTGGSKVEHTFKLKNTGDETVKIRKIECPCPCTVALSTKDEIPPGEHLLIKAMLKVPAESKNVERSIYIHTNVPEQKKIKLSFRGVAFMPIATVPKRVFFGEFTQGSSPKKHLTIHKGEGKKLQITGVRANSRDLMVEMISPESSQIIRAEITVKGSMPQGKFHEQLLIDYSCEDVKATHEVPVDGVVLGEIGISPRMFFFGVIDGSKEISKTIRISSRIGKELKIVEVQKNLEYVTVKLVPLEDRTRYHIIATIRADAPEGELSDKIRIKTDSVMQPLIQVPLYCIISRK